MPKRVIEGQATNLARSIHNIRYDPLHDEILVGNPVAQAVMVFRGGAHGEEPPIRVIQGPRTMLWDPDHVDVDPVHNEIFVPEGDKILVFPREANGDVPPIRVIQGPATRMVRVRGIAIDPVHELIIVTADRVGGKPSSEDMPDGAKGAILIFDRTADGNAKPRGVIGPGPTTGFGAISNLVVSPKGWIVARGYSGSTGERGIRIWGVDDNGDVPPRMIFGGPNSKLTGGGDVALNPGAQELIVHGDSGFAGYYLPEIF